MKILLISPLPTSKEKYTWQYTVDLIKLCKNIEFDIISDEGLYSGDSLDKKIKLNFKKTRFFTIPFQLLNLIKQKNYDAVHFQYEHKIFGSIHKTYVVLLFSSLIRLFGKKFVITIHNTPNKKDIYDFTYLWNNKGRHKPSMIKTNIIWFFYLLATKIIVLISSKVILHEQFQIHTLKKDYGIANKKTFIIPHHLYKIENSQNIIDYSASPTKLLFFGFIAPYKGVDELINCFESECKEGYELIICGSKPKYQDKNTQEKIDKWYEKLRSKKNLNIIWKDAVQNDQIPNLFNNSHYVFLPYKSVFGSSGILSWSLKLNKRFILSEHFSKTPLKKIPTMDLGIKNAINQWKLNYQEYEKVIKFEVANRDTKLIEAKMIDVYAK